MKNKLPIRKRLPMILAVVGIVAIGLSAVGSTRATLAYYSEDYIAQVDVKSIGVTLLENGKSVSWRDYLHKDDSWYEATGVLLSTMLEDAGDKQVVLDKEYKEELAVQNSGTIDEYVRVELKRSWVDADGKTKRVDLDPELIEVDFTNNGWVEDTSAQTIERNVFYYSSILKSGATTSPFADSITISGKLACKVNEETFVDDEGYTNITTTYEYDGATFVLEANVDAVQTHNATEAIKSAWGVDVSIGADGSLSLR